MGGFGGPSGLVLVRLRPKPIGEILAAAIAGRRRRLVLAACHVGRAGEPNVEMIVVAVPRAHLVEPRAIWAGLFAERLLDRRVDEDPRDFRIEPRLAG